MAGDERMIEDDLYVDDGGRPESPEGSQPASVGEMKEDVEDPLAVAMLPTASQPPQPPQTSTSPPIPSPAPPPPPPQPQSAPFQPSQPETNVSWSEALSVSHIPPEGRRFARGKKQRGRLLLHHGATSNRPAEAGDGNRVPAQGEQQEVREDGTATSTPATTTATASTQTHGPARVQLVGNRLIARPTPQSGRQAPAEPVRQQGQTPAPTPRPSLAWLTGPERPSDRVMELNARVVEREEKLAEAQLVVDGLREQTERTRKENEALQSEVEKLRELAGRRESDHQQSRGTAHKAERDFALANNTLLETEATLETVKEEHEKAKRELVGLKKELADRKTEVTQVTNELEAVRGEVQKLFGVKAEKDAAVAAWSDMDRARQNWEATAHQFEAERDHAQSQVGQAEQQSRALQASLDRATARVHECEAQISTMRTAGAGAQGRSSSPPMTTRDTSSPMEVSAANDLGSELERASAWYNQGQTMIVTGDDGTDELLTEFELAELLAGPDSPASDQDESQPAPTSEDPSADRAELQKAIHRMAEKDVEIAHLESVQRGYEEHLKTCESLRGDFEQVSQALSEERVARRETEERFREEAVARIQALQDEANRRGEEILAAKADLERQLEQVTDILNGERAAREQVQEKLQEDAAAHVKAVQAAEERFAQHEAAVEERLAQVNRALAEECAAHKRLQQTSQEQVRAHKDTERDHKRRLQEQMAKCESLEGALAQAKAAISTARASNEESSRQLTERRAQDLARAKEQAREQFAADLERATEKFESQLVQAKEQLAREKESHETTRFTCARRMSKEALAHEAARTKLSEQCEQDVAGANRNLEEERAAFEAARREITDKSAADVAAAQQTLVSERAAAETLLQETVEKCEADVARATELLTQERAGHKTTRQRLSDFAELAIEADARAASVQEEATASASRADKEQSRANSEELRASSEAERANMEASRADSEQSRADKEERRANQEESRANSEGQRATEQAIRAHSEWSRAESEEYRANSEASRAVQAEAELAAAQAQITRLASTEERHIETPQRVGASFNTFWFMLLMMFFLPFILQLLGSAFSNSDMSTLSNPVNGAVSSILNVFSPGFTDRFEYAIIDILGIDNRMLG